MTAQFAGQGGRTHLCVTCHQPFLRPAGKPGPMPRCNACRDASRNAKAPDPTTSRHLVAAVHFQGHAGPSGTAPIECTCGVVVTVDDWIAHRRSAGLTTRSLMSLGGGVGDVAGFGR